jgi:TatD DNase family protein
MYFDTHAHLDGEEFRDDLDTVIQRAREAGCAKVFVPAIDYPTSLASLDLARRYPGYLYPMVGLHPEEVRPDYPDQLQTIKSLLVHSLEGGREETSPIAIGEVGLDFYWSREYEHEQLAAFEQQVQWSVETRLPLMIHCRKAQNEMVAIIKRYARELPGGVFHCFTGNEHEALELLQFPQFVLGIGGVFTFKKSHLPEVLPAVVPLSRIVLETDSPYMAPVPMRGQRNEPSFITHVITRLAQAYQVPESEVSRQTTETAHRLFFGV